jgi:mRNA interferase RelE/StbE
VSWDYRIEPTAARDLGKLGPSAALQIRAYLNNRIRGTSDPRMLGKPLRGKLHGFWRYRVRDYRLLCRLENEVLIVVVVAVGHRSTIYEA